MISFRQKNILMGVSGSIAAYKVIDWLRAIQQEDGNCTVVMTEAATKFITPLTFAALSGNPVHSNMFAPQQAEQIPHINLAHEADCIIIAPATAQTIARLAHGSAEDLLSTICLAAKVPVIICPAMNCNMYQHPATIKNINTLREIGYHVVEPESGLMACGDNGPGRLPEWQQVRDHILAVFAPQDLEGRHILITAGPTRESLDPVRFLGNHSTGKMGYALARTAHMRGGAVTLVTGPTTLPQPAGVTIIKVTTALEMEKEVMAQAGCASIIIKAAAVADYRFTATSTEKLKKTRTGSSLAITPNPDILAELGAMKKKGNLNATLVGFAAESHDHIQEGKRKLSQKNLDCIAVNDILGEKSGFASDTNAVTLISRSGDHLTLPLLSKEETAHRIWNFLLSHQ